MAEASTGLHDANQPDDVEAISGWWSSPRLAVGAIVAAGLLALGLCLHQLSLPGVLRGVDEYDDGFYLGTVMRLATGSLPYKDFVYPQPPGLPLLLLPFGLVGRAVGTRTIMAAIRILTAFVTAGNAALAASLLRRRGVLPALVAGVALALFPLAVTADKTLMLEPYLVFFCLVSACTMFKGDDLAGPRRLVVAGIILGFAGTLKLWAVFPALVAIACCLPKWRNRLRPFGAGLIAGFVIPTLPFVVLAPGNFFHDLVGIQFLRHRAPNTGSIADRILDTTGLNAVPSVHAPFAFAFTLAALFVVFVAIAYAVPVRRTLLDWWVLGGAGLGIGAMLVSPDVHFHYTYFTAAFVALVLGVGCDRISRYVGAVASRPLRRHPATRTVVALVALGSVAAACAWGVGQQFRFDRLHPTIITAGELSPTVEATIPRGACTVTDQPALTLLSNRFVPDRATCPDVVDTFSTWIAYDPDVLPPSSGPYDGSLVAKWRAWLGAADYAVFSGPTPFRIPWRPDLLAWFDQHYKLVTATPSAYVYEFVGVRGT